MAELYTMTQAGLQKANDTFVRERGGLLTLEKEQVDSKIFTRKINGYDKYIDLSQGIKDECEDIEVYGMDLKPTVDDQGIKLRVDGREFKLTEWSLRQMSEKIGVPANYAVSMAEARKYSLFMQNFQSWIDSHVAGKKFLVRTYKDYVRGFLSDSYRTTDTDFILPLFQEGLMTTNMNFMLDKAIMNPEYTNMRVVSDRQISVGGDPHFTGFSFITSDVGRASMKMEFFVYRSKCTNGMMFGKHGGMLFRSKHINKNYYDPNVFKESIVASLSDLPKLVSMAEEALQNANKREVSDADFERIISEYKAYTGSGKKETEQVKELLKDRVNTYNNEKRTLWSVTNAFTEIAQGLQVEKAEKMEDFAGHILLSKYFAA